MVGSNRVSVLGEEDARKRVTKKVKTKKSGEQVSGGGGRVTGDATEVVMEVAHEAGKQVDTCKTHSFREALLNERGFT